MLQIATPDDFSGINDDQKVRAAIASTEPVIAFHARMHQLSDPTPIPVRTGLTLLGPGKQCGRGIQRLNGGGHLFRGGSLTSEVAGFVIDGLDILGADAVGTVDRVFYGTNAKQCQMRNCLTWKWTGTAFYIDGPDSNDNESRNNRMVGGNNSGSSECGIYHVEGNMARSIGDYVSFYSTNIRATASQVVIAEPIIEGAKKNPDGTYGDGIYVDGGCCVIKDGWFDTTTLGVGRTIIQARSVIVFPKRNRGVYPTSVSIADPSKWFPEYNMS